MGTKAEHPFNSIESAYQFIELLNEVVNEAAAHIEAELGAAAGNQRLREALLLVRHKLSMLSSNMHENQRLLNDLKILRRVLFDELDEVEKQKVGTGSVSAKQILLPKNS